MARVTNYRAPVRLVFAVLLGIQSFQTLCAQYPGMAQPQQQMWVNPGSMGQGQMMQVGPDGAVNLDQTMMMQQPQYGGTPYYAGQPVMATPGAQPSAMPYAQPYAQPFAQPYGQPYAAQPWGAQAVQPQSSWGPPWLQLPNPDALAAGPIPPSYIHRTSIFGEFLYVRPRNAEVAYALPIDGPVAPVLGNEVPVGPVAIVDPEYDIAFRAGLNYALNAGASLRGQYTRIHNSVDNEVTVDAPTVLRSLVSHPLGANAATDTLDASATLDTNLDQIDVDFRSLWMGCECNCAYAISWLVGVSAAKLDQDFSANYETIGVTNVATAVEFQGVGMRFGLEGERFFPANGLFVYGSGITSFMFGDFDASYAQVNSLNGTEAFTSWSAGRIVPVFDLEAGAGWMGVNRHLRLSAGYRMTTWFNVVKTEDWIWAVQNHNFTNLDGTLTFDGLVGRAEWLF
ncbi:MAG: Lpg1974 family pore-forming outer membrane protein [Pirellulales bacterium]